MLEIALNAFNIPRANLGKMAYASTFYETISFSIKTESNTLFKSSAPSMFMNYIIIVIVIFKMIIIMIIINAIYTNIFSSDSVCPMKRYN